MTPPSDPIIFGPILALMNEACGYLLSVSNSSEFWLQVFIFVTGIVGQILVAKKRISAFFFWFVGNFAVVIATVPKGMYGMAILYTVYIGFNLYSIYEWKKDGRSTRSPHGSSAESHPGSAALQG